LHPYHCGTAFSNLLNLHNCAEVAADAFATEQQRVGNVANGPYSSTFGMVAELVKEGVEPQAVRPPCTGERQVVGGEKPEEQVGE
jgi:hypothetical protein